ncbi:helix-turn-helix transcriptional regulator [Chitinilyticum piscinae]|uniref:Response regulator transcription factor n=1 Tax=Chitinilyticum piscinae TaxID=2866724 RepID=A0A8J7FZ34_9NEIS|nr:response regulator transcription factor [Chitinilyticum piscinae]MBE9608333.1 response regulator transcription factor [Chitinilyticum piscinae]
MQTLYLVSHDSGLLQHWQQAASGQFRCETASPDWAAGPDALVLLDLAHPELAGRAPDWWQTRAREGLLIACNTLPDDHEGLRLLGWGVRGYCHALAPAGLLVQVLQVVAAGEIWAGRTLVQRLLGALQQLPGQQAAATGKGIELLSEREQQVAQLAARGAANKEIARELDITERTVKAHLSAAFTKLEVADRVQLTLKLNGLRP